MGSPAEHQRGGRPGLGAVRRRQLLGGAHLFQPGVAPGDPQRAVLLPSGHDRAGPGPDRPRPSGPPPCDGHQPALLDPVVEHRGPGPGFHRGPVLTGRASSLLPRLAVVLALGAAMFGGAGVAAAPPASAHPLGNFTVNRYSGLSLSPGRVRVLYVLDMAEIPTYQELPAIDTNGDGSESPAEKHQWAIAQAPRILAHLSLSDDGVAVPLRVSGASMEFRAGQAGLPILRFVATFTGPLADRSGSISYHDGNYADRIGWKEITVRSESGVAITGASVGAVSVSRELLAYPKDLLLSPLNVTTATFSFRPGKAT